MCDIYFRAVRNFLLCQYINKSVNYDLIELNISTRYEALWLKLPPDWHPIFEGLSPMPPILCNGALTMFALGFRSFS